MRTRSLGYAATLLLCALACYPTTTIVLVRHAERPPGTDPDLLPEGRERAGHLATALERGDVRAIFHTTFKRTHQTAESLAARTGLTMTEVPYTGGQESAHVNDVLQRILGSYGGRTVVYVGHTSTVPALIAALGITPAPTLAETVYNRFFVITKRKSATGLMEVQYGR